MNFLGSLNLFRLFVLFMLLFILNPVYSQNYMDEIVNKSCECLICVPDSLDSEEFNMKLGLCMLEASMPYKKQLKKEFGIDLDNIDVEGARLGKLIGIRMTTVCPDALVKITQRASETEKQGRRELMREHGFITGIDDDFFVVFTLKDENGKISKYYWLSFIDSGIELTENYTDLMGKPATILYEEQEFFDPRIKEYRKFNIIKELLLSDN